MANLIEKYPVTLIYKKILKDCLSGELVIEGENFTKTLTFQEGELQNAVSDLQQDRLGEVLYANKKITGEQLKMLRKMKDTSSEKFGKILVNHKVLTKHDLFAALQDQVRFIAISVFFLTTGQWSFTVSPPGTSTPKGFSVDLARVIIEGSEALTDFSYYKRRFDFRSPLTLPIPEEVGKMLSSDEIKFYIKLTKCDSISTSQIASVLNIPDHPFWSQMALLYLLSVIDFTEFRVDGELNRRIEIVSDLHNKLTAHSIDHYELLELKNTATVSEVKDKYFSFSKAFDPDVMTTAPDSMTREMTDYVIKKAALAFDTLSHEEKKKAYDTGQFKKVATTDPAGNGAGNEGGNEGINADGGQRSRNLYLKAHSLYEEKKYLEAVRLLEKAVELDNSRANYYLLLGLSQIRIPSMRPYAEKNLMKVVQMEPWNADPLFYLGQLYWAENLVKKAERCFRKALEINMEHTLAAKMISKIEGRGQKKHKPFFSVFGKKG
ncbi:MAG: DnaJ domain-containing protein [bacterium]|nr:DnaJ domain-containing protein [bacterium]